MLESFLFPAMSLGFSATSMPGPLQAYLLNVTLNYGWRRGLLVILSPLIVDGPIILLTVFVLRQIPDIALQAIRIAGGLLLLWIAWRAWRQLRAGASFEAGEDKLKGNASPRRILGTAVAMNAISPGPYIFWSTIIGPTLIQALEVSLWAGIATVIGFYAMFLGGLALLVFVFHRLGTISPEATRYMLVLTMALLLWFGTRLILAEAFGMTALHQIIGQVILVLTVACIGWSWYQNRQQRKFQSAASEPLSPQD